VSDEQLVEIKMARYVTIRISAETFMNHDNCLDAAETHVTTDRGLVGYSLTPRFEDEEREFILLDVPERYVRAGDDIIGDRIV
jgi:hypothetical protein